MFIYNQLIARTVFLQTLATLEEDLAKSDHYKFLYHPHTGRCVQVHVTRSDKVSHPSHPLYTVFFMAYHGIYLCAHVYFACTYVSVHVSLSVFVSCRCQGMLHLILLHF